MRVVAAGLLDHIDEISVAVFAFLGVVIASPLALRIYDRRARTRSDEVVAEMKQELSTGNGANLGATVHRMEQTLDFVATTVRAQGQVMEAHGAVLGRGDHRFDEIDGRLSALSDTMQDQRIEQEQFVARVTPLCDWVERQQREETA